jgi:thioredoxin-related protein
MTNTRSRTSPRRVAATLLAAVLLAAALPAWAGDDGESRPTKIEWKSYREALNKARSEDKPVMLHFTASWCSWCKKMKRETYTDRRVIRYLGENYAVSLVDTEKLPTLSRKYRVGSLPTLWFLDADGKPLTSVPGYVGADKLLRILEYISTKSYEKVDYDTWLDRKRKS